MNSCLLLIILLFSSRTNTKDCKPHHHCGCSRSTPVCQTPPPPMPRTQFPYLDSDHGSCGCEGNKN
ncbi:MAG: hypothetical protein IKW28_10000 [Lachnospiraceae bacterium]|nr:hypothetical protein [Lachnospiraceae bacterium]